MLLPPLRHAGKCGPKQLNPPGLESWKEGDERKNKMMENDGRNEGRYNGMVRYVRERRESERERERERER